MNKTMTSIIINKLSGCVSDDVTMDASMTTSQQLKYDNDFYNMLNAKISINNSFLTDYELRTFENFDYWPDDGTFYSKYCRNNNNTVIEQLINRQIYTDYESASFEPRFQHFNVYIQDLIREKFIFSPNFIKMFSFKTKTDLTLYYPCKMLNFHSDNITFIYSGNKSKAIGSMRQLLNLLMKYYIVDENDDYVDACYVPRVFYVDEFLFTMLIHIHINYPNLRSECLAQEIIIYWVEYITSYLLVSDYKYTVLTAPTYDLRDISIYVGEIYGAERLIPLTFSKLDFKAVFAFAPETQMVKSFNRARMLLLLSGDVEENPGPVLSTLRTNHYLAKSSTYRKCVPQINLNPFSSFTNSVNNLADSIRSKDSIGLNLNVEQLKADLSTQFPALCLTLTGLYRARKDKVLCLTILAQFLMRFNLGVEFISGMFEKLYEKFLAFISVIGGYLGLRTVSQSDNDNNAIKDFLVSTFAYFTPDYKKTVSVCKDINFIARGVSGLEQLTERLLKFCQIIMEKIQIYVYGVLPDNIKTDVSKYQANAIKLLQAEYRNNLSVENLANELDDLILVGQELTKVLVSKDHFALRQIVLRLNSELITSRSKLIVLNKQTLRQKPYCLYLYGASGVGKSFMLPFLMPNFMALDCETERQLDRLADFVDQIHYRQEENEYWDGLQKEHKYMIVDDFGTVADNCQPASYAELIRYLNDAPAVAHMSAVQDKGQLKLDFRFVLMTSNTQIPVTTSVTHIDAIHRRLEGNMWKVSIKPEYCKSRENSNDPYRIDFSKVDNNCFNKQIYLFEQYDLKLNVTKTLDYDEFVDYVAYDYSLHKMRSSTITKNIKSNLDVIIEKQRRVINAQPQIFETLRLWKNKDSVDVFAFYEENKTFIRERIVDSGDLSRLILDNTLTRDNLNPYLAEFYTLLHILFPHNPFVEYSLKREFSRLVNVGTTPTWLTYFNRFVAYVLCTISVRLVFSGLKYLIWDPLYSFVSGLYGYLFPSKYGNKICKNWFTIVKMGEELYVTPHRMKFIMKQDPEFSIMYPLDLIFHQHDLFYFKLKPNIPSKHPIRRYIDFIRKGLSQVPKRTNGLNDDFIFADMEAFVDTVNANELVETVALNKSESKYSNPIAVKVSRTLAEMASPEVCVDQNLSSVMQKVEANHTCILTRGVNNDIVQRGFGTFFDGKLMVTFLHVLPHLFEKQQVYLRPVQWKNKTPVIVDVNDIGIIIPAQLGFPAKKIKFSEFTTIKDLFNDKYYGKDLVVLDFSNCPGISAYPSILKHFVTVEDLNKINNQNVRLRRYNEDGVIEDLRDRNVKVLDRYSEPVVTPLNYDNLSDIQPSGGICYVRDGYSYDVNTQVGDCGSILYVESNYIQRKIIGLHVAGVASGYDTGKAYSVSLTQQMLTSCLEISPQILLDPKLEPCKEFDVKSGMLYIGTVDDPTMSAGKSQILESLVYEKRDESRVKPAYLKPIKRDGLVIDPYLLGIDKYTKVSPYLPSALIEQTFEDFNWFKNLQSNKFQPRLLTFEECIRGIDGENFWSSIPISTSPGYSWPKKGLKGKRAWVTEDWIHPDVENRTKSRIDDALNNVRKDHKYVCTLKDETRPIEKVEKGKTRVFTVPQLDYVIASRQYFGAYFINTMKNRIDNRVLIGINMYSGESDRLMKLLIKHPHVLTGDFINWDSSVRADIALKILEYINSWYLQQKDKPRDEILRDNKVREVLYMDLIYPMVMVNEHVLLLTHCVPSGHPGTAIINTDYNIFRDFLVYKLLSNAEKWKPLINSDQMDKLFEAVKCFDTSSYRGLPTYLEHTEAVFYGDDMLMTVSPKLIDFVNYQTLQLGNYVIGHSYTTSDKKEFIEKKYDTFKEANILKRSFVFDYEYQRYIAPLDLSTIYEIPNWMKKGLEQVSQTSVNIETAAREMALHGREKYNEFTSDYTRICKVLRESGVPINPYFKSYEDMKSEVLQSALYDGVYYKKE